MLEKNKSSIFDGKIKKQLIPEFILSIAAINLLPLYPDLIIDNYVVIFLMNFELFMKSFLFLEQIPAYSGFLFHDCCSRE
jgi:hypothetical protein